MLSRASSVLFVCCTVLFLGQIDSLPQTRTRLQAGHRPISFFIYTNSSIGERGDDAIRAQFQEFVNHLGHRSQYGSVGIALNYPYLTFVIGHGPSSFTVDRSRIKAYEANVRIAHEMGLPVVVGFNDGPWFTPGGPFYECWKTTDGGAFLARYQDGQVNESLHSKGPLTKEELQSFLGVDLYDTKRSKDALLLTLSPSATRYRRARLKVLDLALSEWRRIDRMYPGTSALLRPIAKFVTFLFAACSLVTPCH